jgi:hypothetical protein
VRGGEVKAHARVPGRACVLVAVLVAGCSEPYYVSLGGNAAELGSDAGATVCTSDEVMLVPGTCGEPAPVIDRCETTSPIVALDADCSARTLVSCPAPVVLTSGSLEQDALAQLLTELLRSCQMQPNALRVRFSAGCATSFAIDFAASLPDAGDATADCVALRLGAERYDCAENIACGVGEIFGVPTSWVEPDWL